MHEDNEAEWILKRLFLKLEESLQRRTHSTDMKLDDMKDGDRGRSLET